MQVVLSLQSDLGNSRATNRLFSVLSILATLQDLGRVPLFASPQALLLPQGTAPLAYSLPTWTDKHPAQEGNPDMSCSSEESRARQVVRTSNSLKLHICWKTLSCHTEKDGATKVPILIRANNRIKR